MLLAFLIATLVSATLTPLVIRTAVTLGLLDVPSGGRRTHRRAVPRVGGVAIFVATAVALGVAIWYGPPLSPVNARFLLGAAIGGTLLFGAGLLDDVRGLRPITKLLVQCAAAAIAYALGARVEALTIAGSSGVALGALSLPFTLIWIVGVTNAFNLIDGLDGLATGIGMVVLATLAVAALALGRHDAVLVAAAMLGALTGFLRYNFPTARIFLGDSGSQFIGYMLALLSVHGSVKSTTAVLVAIPLSALAVPLLDMLAAVGRRWLRGVPIFSADSRHVHHRLLAIGLQPHRASAVLCTCSAVFALVGLAAAFSPPRGLFAVTALGGAVMLMIVLYGIRQLDYHEFMDAWMAVAGGFRATRHVIHDQIRAGELARLLPFAEGIPEMRAMLQDAAEDFGFLSIGIEPVTGAAGAAGSAGPAVPPPGGASVPGSSWKLEHPLASPTEGEEEVYVLRICCDVRRSYRPYGAVRVARALVPVMETWLQRRVDATEAQPPSIAEWWAHADRQRQGTVTGRVQPALGTVGPRSRPAFEAGPSDVLRP